MIMGCRGRAQLDTGGNSSNSRKAAPSPVTYVARGVREVSLSYWFSNRYNIVGIHYGQ
jgi:hypothetical protein